MKPKTVITLRHIDTGTVEVFSTFKGACLVKELPYNYLKSWKLPAIYKDYIIERVPVQ